MIDSIPDDEGRPFLRFLFEDRWRVHTTPAFFVSLECVLDDRISSILALPRGS